MNTQDTMSDEMDTARGLIDALCEQTITSPEMAELERLITSRREVKRLYIRMMHLQAGLHRHAAVLGTGRARHRIEYWRHALKVPALAAAAVLALAAGAWTLWGHGRAATPAQSYAATVETVSDPEWITADAPQRPGQGLARGQSCSLESGCVQFVFANGCHVVVEGPADFTVVSGSEMELRHGRISATMLGGGFVVKSPTGVIKDLGTRFGVAVLANGNTEVDVFEGRVTAAVRQADPKTPSAEVMVYEGQAVRLDGTDVQFDPVGAVPQRFVSRLNGDFKTLDVVDLFCGGDGTTRRRGMGLDSTTGRYGVLPAEGPRPGTSAYRPVSALTVIDGCFLPDGAKGEQVIDSAGDRFQFPPTDGLSCSQIWSGGTFPWYKTTAVLTVLSGIDYSTPNHSLLCIHSNNGVTFDLDGIRRLHPGREVSDFHCVVGNSFVNGYKTELPRDPRADVYVLVNGKSRFERHHFTNNRDGIFDVKVGLDATDRFITLATTDGGDEYYDDWIIWADPTFDMSAR